MLKKGLLRLGIVFLYLTSLLPFWFLYLISDVLFVVIYYIVHYRRAVVQQNLANAFPEKSVQERRQIERKYYRYLADLIVETVKMITVSEKQIQKRVVATNSELVHEYFAKGKSIIAVAGHYCNWEMAALNFNFVTDKRFMIVYKPLSNEMFDDFFIKIRSRFGGQPVAMKQTLRKMVEYRKELTVSVLVGDQTPVRHEVNYFTDFLNQPTAVFLGIEKIAKTIDAAVVFYDMKRVKRGYYTYTLIPLTETPKETAEHEITDMHVQYLDSMIRREPQYWIWSHRRWKFGPEDLQQ
ncbi:lysophospholipid acyltransferase family protein [Mucilaginibacter dorajii]|uniref:Lysophospholipid acyltransferase family protein n=1 Tax=Mucilaginibacter dorajii TaxID=692994 RepID=A0ABP7QQ86_9SPHI|nr:lysophospholipid acyltransferase family protein [Mucilaginibacter dorajii]MCS3733894.1 KDO2-lipid IV(A) lauroyltransferase [Mucilaginibacter dorajii]